MSLVNRGLTPALLVLLVTACRTELTDPSSTTAPGQPPIALSLGAPGVGEVSDGAGTAWRQLTETVGITWNQAAQLCPRDGNNPCYGRIGQTDLTGWVWATDLQVVNLLARYEPAIVTNRSLSGAAYGPGVAAFFVAFRPTTTGGCSGSGYVFTCSFGSHASGWSATSPYPGSGYAATVQSGFNTVPLMQAVTDAVEALGLVARPDVPHLNAHAEVGLELAHEIGLTPKAGAIAHMLLHGPATSIMCAHANKEPFLLDRKSVV